MWSITVPENRKNPDSRDINIQYVILKAKNSSSQKDPVVFLQGGPGAGSILMYQFFQRHAINRDYDVILVDQRGTGFSTSFCGDLGEGLMSILAKDLDTKGELEAMKDLVKPCKEGVENKGIDLAGTLVSKMQRPGGPSESAWLQEMELNGGVLWQSPGFDNYERLS